MGITKDYELGDIVVMKKQHPCKKAETFTIIRMGADIKIKCDGCGRSIMLERMTFEKQLKKVVGHREEE